MKFFHEMEKRILELETKNSEIKELNQTTKSHIPGMLIKVLLN